MQGDAFVFLLVAGGRNSRCISRLFFPFPASRAHSLPLLEGVIKFQKIRPSELKHMDGLESREGMKQGPDGPTTHPSDLSREAEGNPSELIILSLSGRMLRSRFEEITLVGAL